MNEASFFEELLGEEKAARKRGNGNCENVQELLTRASSQLRTTSTIVLGRFQNLSLAFRNDRRLINGYGGPSPGQIGSQEY